MGGSSGILLSIFVAAVGARAGEPPQWPAALRAGAIAVQRYGGAQEGDRTLLDALLPAIRALEEGQGLAAAAHAAREGAARTAAMTTAKAGRASYVRGDALRGVADPGAAAVAAIFEVMARA